MLIPYVLDAADQEWEDLGQSILENEYTLSAMLTEIMTTIDFGVPTNNNFGITIEQASAPGLPALDGEITIGTGLNVLNGTALWGRNGAQSYTQSIIYTADDYLGNTIAYEGNGYPDLFDADNPSLGRRAFYFTGGQGNDQLTGSVHNTEQPNHPANYYYDDLRGGAGDDVLRGDPEDALSGDRDHLEGEAGDDQLYGGGADDELIGNEMGLINKTIFRNENRPHDARQRCYVAFGHRQLLLRCSNKLHPCNDPWPGSALVHRQLLLDNCSCVILIHHIHVAMHCSN